MSVAGSSGPPLRGGRVEVLLVQAFGLPEAAPFSIEAGERVLRAERTAMGRAQDDRLAFKTFLEERFGFLILAQALVGPSQVVHGHQGIGVLFARSGALGFHAGRQQRYGGLELPAVDVDLGQAVFREKRVRMCRTGSARQFPRIV